MLQSEPEIHLRVDSPQAAARDSARATCGARAILDRACIFETKAAAGSAHSRFVQQKSEILNSNSNSNLICVRYVLRRNTHGARTVLSYRAPESSCLHPPDDVRCATNDVPAVLEGIKAFVAHGRAWRRKVDTRFC